ncbi:hypothetical protein HYPSUDRAFT_55513 [Hypholoma sublateritium FD-334 SS-4]|uniref:Kinetochore protein Sos7 coiled-coil domain-containing protein n=1 Tax=Hypholoma sublateritium (strain FD-334 SS-4) TaxID=945553 RepID=A0A0D2PNE8_HYPSF|nr:hypothetical protein HYPSUDRAFT_55513 [Hypholoma sublateritium FD-334 SS-4]
MNDEDEDDVKAKDPAIIAMEVADQIAYLRKLKFQYLEQNAKDKYVKSIVSDIDDAPIVTAEENKVLARTNEDKKEKLKIAKGRLNEVQSNIRLLGPMVEQDYQRVKEATDRAALLSQKIIDARTALILLRQTHPKPRLTIPLAEQKLQDQVEEMQMLNDQVQDIKQKAKMEKGRVKTGTVDVENLRLQASEAEKAVKAAQLDEDDSRLVPLYDWYTASLALHRSISNLADSHSVSENELQLTYKIDMPSPSRPHHVVIALIFAPDTRKLAAAQVSGLDELGVEAGDVIDAHVQVDDPHGLIAALLARARAAALA